MQNAILIAGLLLAVAPPHDPNLRVHDLAALLSAEQRSSLESLAQDVERQTSCQFAIVTVTSLEGKTVEQYANELFNAWGIGQRNLNNGVLLLVAPQERRMRIEVGYGVEPLLTDSLAGEIRDQTIIPHFKRGDYPAGIMAGAQRIADVLRSNPTAARGVANSAPMLARTSRRSALVANSGVGLAALALVILGIMVAIRRLYSTTAFVFVTAVGLGLLIAAAYFTWQLPRREQPLALFSGVGATAIAAWIFNLGKYRRFGPHGCSKCGTHLELLSEQKEDPKLSTVQQLEETIGSVDYDVWFCPACLNADTERYIKPFSGFQNCPKCNARTYKVEPQKVIQSPTRMRTGRARIDGRCVSCNHKTVEHVLLPVIPAPDTTSSSSLFGGGGGSSGFGGGSSSGGGGFGGGSSGGGGASGGW